MHFQTEFGVQYGISCIPRTSRLESSVVFPTFLKIPSPFELDYNFTAASFEPKFTLAVEVVAGV